MNDDLEKTVRDAAILGLVMFALFFLQGCYNLFEFFRHAVLEGMTEHGYSHLRHAWPLLALVAFPHYGRAGLRVLQNFYRTTS